MIKSFEVLNKYGIKNSFISMPMDLGPNNSNRKKEISEILNTRENKIFFSNQCHSANVEVVRENDSVDMEKFQNNDGLITNIKGITLLTYVADCQGIFLYDPIKKVIGNIHSGWKGVSSKIVINAIDKMISEFNSNKKDILCFFNPSIHACCFEIEEDVLNIFKHKLGSIVEKYIVNIKEKNNVKKYYLDLIGLNKEILIDYGILEKNIYVMDECTCCTNDYHSYRRNKTTKRNGCVIAL